MMQGRLLLGVSYKGTVYYEFSVKCLTMRGQCHALELIADLKLSDDDESQAANTLRDLAFLAAQVEIIGIPQVKLTPAFLLDGLSTDDYALIVTQINELRKKSIAAGEVSLQVAA